MGKRLGTAVGVLLGLAVGTTPSEARLLPSWPYRRLMKEADLVVVAVPVRTESTKDEGPPHEWNFEFVGQDTRFTVEHTLKGAGKAEVTVLHFRLGGLKKGADPNVFDSILVVDGPLHVVFPARGRPEYLLFLKARPDGRYEPVSGQIDPALSVRRLAEADRETEAEK